MPTTKPLCVAGFVVGALMLAGCPVTSSGDDAGPSDASESGRPLEQFGVHGANDSVFDPLAPEVGASWVRHGSGVFSWGLIEKTKGSYEFTKQDALVSASSAAGIHVLATIRSLNLWDQCPTGCAQPAGHMLYPKDEAAYLAFIRAMVERYDGDGKDDAPGSPFVDGWQIENEVDGSFWDDTPQSYARLILKTAQVIREESPKAMVVVAGASAPRGWTDFYRPMLVELERIAPGQRLFDAVDLHWFGYAGEYLSFHGHELVSVLAEMRADLKAHGYEGTPIWITETATHAGKAVVDQFGTTLPEQDERTQAAELLRRYAHFLGQGVEKVFWVRLTELHHSSAEPGRANDFFESTGLINNALNAGDPLDPADDNDSSKKLAFFSYKLLAMKTRDCDWTSAQNHNGATQGLFHYSVSCPNRGRVHLAWLDPAPPSGSATISLPVTTAAALTTTGVPTTTQGKQVADFATAFATAKVQASSGKVEVTLGREPLLIEEDQ
ncbi:MAG: hypothetical protein HY901_38385 [Deltaproteobacteria bacterium]|nr:hypothetical protein [Deltaproteobacteria bacterium]